MLLAGSVRRQELISAAGGQWGSGRQLGEGLAWESLDAPFMHPPARAGVLMHTRPAQTHPAPLAASRQ